MRRVLPWTDQRLAIRNVTSALYTIPHKMELEEPSFMALQLNCRVLRASPCAPGCSGWLSHGRVQLTGTQCLLTHAEPLSHVWLWPMDCGLPGFSDHAIFQARILSGLPFSTPGALPDPESKPISLAYPALAGGFLPLCHLCHPSVYSEVTFLICNCVFRWNFLTCG